MARRSSAGTTRAGLITTVNMTTGEILDVGPGHSERHVRRLVSRAQKKRASNLRAAAVTHWRLGRAS